MSGRRRYNTGVAIVLLQETGRAGLPAPIVIALLVGAGVSVLALWVSLRIARRMRAIGDAAELPPPADEQAD